LGLWRIKLFGSQFLGLSFLFLWWVFRHRLLGRVVMGTVLLWGMKNGRLGNSQNAIVFAAAVMLLINPLLLRWDIGFQLSFLATLGIVYFYPITENHLIK